MRARRWYGPVTLAGLGLAFALVPLARGQLFFYWDNSQQHYAAMVFLARWLREGTIPFWWPESMAGVPIVAEGPAAHFHPIHLALTWLFATPTAFMLEIGLTFAVSGLGAYAYLRLFRLHPAVCTFGGFVHMFSSMAIVLVRNTASLRGSCLVSVAMFLSERYSRDARRRDGVALAVVIALQLLSGYPTPALVTAIAVCTYTIVRTLQLHGRQGFSAPTMRRASAIVLGLVAFIALGAALAAVQLLPTWLHIPQSIRSGGLNPASAASYLSSKPEHWLQWILPYAVHPLRSVTTAEEASARSLSWFYMGAFVPFAVAAVFWWRRRWTHPCWALTIGVAISVLLAVGDRTPVLPFLMRLPVLNSFRYPSKFLYWASFSIAMLAAFGLQHLLVHRRQGRRFPSRFVIAWIAVMAVAAAVAAVASLPPAGIAVSLMFAGLALGAGVFLLGSNPSRRGVAMALVLIVTFADVAFFRVVVDYAHSVPRAVAESPPAIATWLARDPDEFRIFSVDGAAPVRLQSEAEHLGFLNGPGGTLFGLEGMKANFSLPYRRPVILSETLMSWLAEHPDRLPDVTGLLSVLNVKYLLAYPNFKAVGWQQIVTAGPITAWRNPAFLPRAFLVGNAVPEPPSDATDIPAAQARFRQRQAYLGDHAGFFDDVVILERHLRLEIDVAQTAILDVPQMPPLHGLGSVSTVTPVAKGRPGILAYEVNTDRPALLYISAAFGPEWSATVNGAGVPVYRANWIGMALMVPSGVSRVDLRFQLRGFGPGLVVTASTALLLAALARISRRRT